MADWLSQERKENLAIWGPVPAPMARRAGRYRFQLLLLLADDRPTHQALTALEDWQGSRRPAGA